MTIAILLAAGGSERLGQPKQLIDWNGQPLVVHTALELASAGCSDIVVVTGAYGEKVRAAFDRVTLSSDIHFADNPDWSQGQATSLHCGVNHVLRACVGEAPVLISLCDQPLIGASYFHRLVDVVNDSDIDVAATRYDRGAGVPACFRRTALRTLSVQRGDIGACKWIRQLPADRVRLFTHPDALLDIDTPADYEALSEARATHR
ncbi:MAG: hypothetical protein CMJ46_07925 [Planctomyces sp.]|nr:hypothetical protein [Planctomyces sp.]